MGCDEKVVDDLLRVVDHWLRYVFLIVGGVGYCYGVEVCDGFFGCGVDCCFECCEV